MKELSIVEKARRFDEVLAMAKECITYMPDEAVNKYMLDMFPELAESEDEKIRKEIIKLVKFFYGSSLVCKHTISKDKMVAWLEKQGEKKTIRHDKNEEPFSILHQDEMRLWSIEEAKDGDVLVASDNSIFIFARVDGYACIHHIALASDGTLKINPRLISAWESVKGVKPATEEQRDKLKKAMLKAGYKWDADKKELKNCKL